VKTGLKIEAVPKLQFLEQLPFRLRRFTSPDKGFAQHHTEGTRPGPAKYGRNEPWE
jgi:hypothetical protein